MKNNGDNAVNSDLKVDFLKTLKVDNYMLGSGDSLEIKISGSYPELDRIVTVDGEGTIYLPNIKELDNGQKIIVGIRPEYLIPSKNGIPAKIAVVEPTGSETHLLLRANDQDLTCVIRERQDFSPGQDVKLTAEKKSIHIFNYENKLRIY